MKYRKYRARSFQEAKLKMLLDVGHHAYIVSQKRVREGGFLRFLGKPMVEITVGIMDEKKLLNMGRTRNGAEDSKGLPDGFNKGRGGARGDGAGENRSVVEGEGREGNKIVEKTEKLSEELEHIKGLLGLILSKEGRNGGGNGVLGSEGNEVLKDDGLEVKSRREEDVRKEEVNKLSSSKDSKEELIKLFMKDEDFNDNFINDICSLSTVKSILSDESKLSVIKSKLREQLAEIISTSDGIVLKEGRTNVIVLVGSTGVGKTTTLAKLAAYYGVFQKKKIKLISIDTYRVGAIQQLKLYADIMDIAFSKVNNVREFELELKLDRYDVVLIDTTGRSQRNVEEIKDIKKYLDIVEERLQVSLVISATTKYVDLVEILDKFDILNYTNIIVTKLDETNSLGQVISAIKPKNRSLSYVTFGQSVPEDIEEGSKNKIFEMILKG